MEIRKIDENSKLINQLIDLSYEWENEHSCTGFFHNNKDTFKGKEIYVMIEDDKVISYLYGFFEESKMKYTILNEGDRIFEIEEIYVKEGYRNQGLGNKLYKYVENDIKNKADIIMLSTATKDYKKILHFYIDELGLTFWNARLYRRIK